MLKLGPQNISALRLGEQKIKKAYLGEELVFDSAPPGLPAGYTELEYIQSSGVEYIDTGFKPSGKTSYEIELLMTYVSRATYPFGANDGTNFMRLFSGSGGTTIQAFYGTQNQTLDAAMTEKATLKQDKNVFSANEIEHTFSEETFSINQNIFIFTENGNGAPNTSRPGRAQLYSCKIYDDDTLVRNFIPCKNPSGAIGLYDIAGKQFYANAGTGTFTAGPAV